MRLIYEPANSLEGHMIINLLEQEGIHARMDGEYLQGGVGELQAFGYIRVMVDEADYVPAKDIVTRWDQQQLPPTGYSIQKNNNHFLAGFIGFIIGGICVAILYSTPVTVDGVDYNGDGTLDEKWAYVNNRVSSVEVDRNLDGKADVIFRYDRFGLMASSRSDENFDGVFETEAEYHNDNIVRTAIDTNSNGIKNLREEYQSGVLVRRIYMSPVTRKPVKTVYFDAFGTMRSAELDTNADGIADNFIEYDAIGEIISETRH